MKRIILFCTLLIPPDFVAAETISFEEVAAAAFDRSPLIQEIEASIGSQRADAVELQTLENPELSAEVRPYVAGGNSLDTEYEVSLSQPLRVSSFGHRQRLARLMTEATTVERKLALQEFTQKLKLLYGKVWGFQESEQAVKKAAARSAELYKKVKNGIEKGLIPQSLAHLLSSEIAKLEITRRGLEADHKRALAQLIHFSATTWNDITLMPLSFDDISSVKLLASADTPLKERLNLRRRVAMEQQKLARLDSFPQFAPRIAFEHTDDGDERVIAGLSFELPFFSRNQSNRTRADATFKRYESESRYYGSEPYRRGLNLLLESLRASIEQSERYRAEVIPTLQRALEAAENELQQGQGSALHVWQILQELLSAEDRRLELWVKALSERVELAILVGQDL